MPGDPRQYLDDIIDAASTIQEYVKGYSYDRLRTTRRPKMLLSVTLR